MGVSGPSRIIESTNSMILANNSTYNMVILSVYVIEWTLFVLTIIL